MEFSRQEYWSGLPSPPPGHLFNPGIELSSPVQVDTYFVHTHTHTHTHTHIHIWEKEMSNHTIFLPGESHWLRSLVGYSPKGHKELNTTQWLQKNTYIYIFIYDPGSYLGETNKSALCQILVFISALLLNYCWFTMFCQFAGVQYFDSHICIHRYISIYTYSVWDSFSF